MLHDDVKLIYTYPNFTSCANVEGMEEELNTWNNVKRIPLPLRASPMSGWVEAVPYIHTKYSLLLHNDGYALDPFFACELVEALKARHNGNMTLDTDEPGVAAAAGGDYVVAAPMLYESKADKSLAAHATQSNLRLVRDGPNGSVTVRHDHSVRRALNRGDDFGEGPQDEFLEDHGFMIETDKIKDVIDPDASYTLEYIDMIMSIRSNNYRVLFVPTARLEFRITEFSWRDIPYFMYKRSEVTCHGTRDYLTAKWKANFPNTGFWTYIKYTIVEQHTYNAEELGALAWKDSASIAFGFFQMMGFNHYTEGPDKVKDYISVLEDLDGGWVPEATVYASRNLKRKVWEAGELKQTKLPIGEILDTKEPSRIRIEADMPLEHLPFGAALFEYSGGAEDCEAAVPKKMLPVCGLVVSHSKANKCSCWVNLPTFKSNSLFVRFLDKLAAMIKLPSRVTTYIEMFMDSERTAAMHLAPLETATKDDPDVKLVLCEAPDFNCTAPFDFDANSRVVRFAGRPPSVRELLQAMK
mmetsp:Transcript_34158/g.78917  ORF Transcript_34158/g.78917 Transcript_34158/m.78917 type:complete len:525 (+) Transcript_34158:490-2064(+)